MDAGGQPWEVAVVCGGWNAAVGRSLAVQALEVPAVVRQVVNYGAGRLLPADEPALTQRMIGGNDLSCPNH
jgi:hypothetical protein